MFNPFRKKKQNGENNGGLRESGFFGAFPENEELIGAPIQGKAVPSSAVNDPVFSKEMLGKGMAIQPTDGRVYSPVHGQVTVMVDSMHALSIRSDEGIELLIHIGLDTVNLQGKYFTRHVSEGDRVDRGQLLLEFDLASLTNEGYDMVCPVIICNSKDYQNVIRFTGNKVKIGDPIFKIEK
ncbi:MAG: PTS glucose transporter subunit IIA [Clostridiales bacterium]|nr:PTS glucose transporter subunit IIA [Clostridiales bacterium]